MHKLSQWDCIQRGWVGMEWGVASPWEQMRTDHFAMAWCAAILQLLGDLSQKSRLRRVCGPEAIPYFIGRGTRWPQIF